MSFDLGIAFVVVFALVLYIIDTWPLEAKADSPRAKEEPEWS